MTIRNVQLFTECQFNIEKNAYGFFRLDVDIVDFFQGNILNENKNMCICAAGIFVGRVHNIVTGKMNMNIKVSICCYICIYIYICNIYIIYIYIYMYI